MNFPLIRKFRHFDMVDRHIPLELEILHCLRLIRHKKFDIPPGVVGGNGVVTCNVSQSTPVYIGGQVHVNEEPLI